jgi:hypothetical protein
MLAGASRPLAAAKASTRVAWRESVGSTGNIGYMVRNGKSSVDLNNWPHARFRDTSGRTALFSMWAECSMYE